MPRYQTPYIQSPDKNACALAVFTMVAQSFFPDTSLDDMRQILRWREGKVVWGAPFYLWLAERGIDTIQFDPLPYSVWAEQGFEAIEPLVGANTFAYYKAHTYDPDSYQQDLRALSQSPLFHHLTRMPVLADLKAALADGAVCDALVDSCALNEVDGFSLHRVVVLEVTSDEVVFHDPVRPDRLPQPARRVSIDHFLSAWPSEQGGPTSCEMCVYNLTKGSNG